LNREVTLFRKEGSPEEEQGEERGNEALGSLTARVTMK
jgi:hypothetical protein